eukprot:TRINITY_DN1018_c0_g1_i1.p1 TRINITY_DN1018_c0_g1~~TRINITY_DN1018_c0_g1_i1.p1  ORF type:complete len:350 (-),score=4.31 TRINITY_DN1018_c0_g1_i1:13-1062(-)
MRNAIVSGKQELLLPEIDRHQGANMNECHHCRQFIDKVNLAECQVKGCKKSYCRICLSSKYKFSKAKALQLPTATWKCPACTRKCSCQACNPLQTPPKRAKKKAIMDSILKIRPPENRDEYPSTPYKKKKYEAEGSTIEGYRCHICDMKLDEAEKITCFNVQCGRAFCRDCYSHGEAKVHSGREFEFDKYLQKVWICFPCRNACTCPQCDSNIARKPNLNFQYTGPNLSQLNRESNDFINKTGVAAPHYLEQMLFKQSTKKIPLNYQLYSKSSFDICSPTLPEEPTPSPVHVDIFGSKNVTTQSEWNQELTQLIKKAIGPIANYSSFKFFRTISAGECSNFPACALSSY